MKKKHILLSLLLGAAALTASADDWHLLIVGRDGKTQVVNMSLIDRIEIRNGLITLTQTDGNTQSFPKAIFEQIDLIDQPVTGISGTTAVATPLKVRATGYTLQVEGIQDGLPVFVYDMNGRTVAQTKGNQDGTATLSVQAFSEGTYVIRCGRQVLKVLKK